MGEEAGSGSGLGRTAARGRESQEHGVCGGAEGKTLETGKGFRMCTGYLMGWNWGIMMRD